MNMKTLVQPILIAAGIALIATAAQANTAIPAITTLYNSTEVGTLGATGMDFGISSEVTQSGSVYTYTYNVAAADHRIPGNGIDAFTVYLLSGIATSSENTPSGWGTGVQNVNNVNWTTLTGDSTANVTFSFTSLYAPIWGYSVAQDAGQWNDFTAFSGASYAPGNTGDTGVVVPNTPPPPPVPDGGLTVALLGVSLVGIQALRRKLG